MGLLNFFKKKVNKEEREYMSVVTDYYSLDMLRSKDKAMLISTVYRCVDLISESVAVLPLISYSIDKQGFKSEAREHPSFNLLDLEPNKEMSSHTFFKCLVTSALLNGNGYALIERDKYNKIESLKYLPHESVDIVWDNNNGTRVKKYRVRTEDKGVFVVGDGDMIHILNFSYDGIIGVSTLEHARHTLGIAYDSESYAKNFFSRGGAISGMLKRLDGVRMTKEDKDAIYNTWEDRLKYGKGGVVIIPHNMDYQSININPKDSQLLETRQFNVIDICRFFSVSPVKAFDLSKSSYSTVEATQLQYLTDTLLPWLSKIEEEINRKVFLPSERGKIKAEFDTSVILRTDKVAQSNYIKNLFYSGAVTPNEIRRTQNLPRIEGGDDVFVPANVIPIDKARENNGGLKSDVGGLGGYSNDEASKI